MKTTIIDLMPLLFLENPSLIQRQTKRERERERFLDLNKIREDERGRRRWVSKTVFKATGVQGESIDWRNFPEKALKNFVLVFPKI